jgi:hypothetical protein
MIPPLAAPTSGGTLAPVNPTSQMKTVPTPEPEPRATDALG